MTSRMRDFCNETNCKSKSMRQKAYIPSPCGSTGWSLTRVYDETQYKLRELNAAGVRDFERFSLISTTCTSHLTFAAVTNFERRLLLSSQNKRKLSISASQFIDLNSRDSHSNCIAVSDSMYECTMILM